MERPRKEAHLREPEGTNAVAQSPLFLRGEKVKHLTPTLSICQCDTAEFHPSSIPDKNTDSHTPTSPVGEQRLVRVVWEKKPTEGATPVDFLANKTRCAFKQFISLNTRPTTAFPRHRLQMPALSGL